MSSPGFDRDSFQDELDKLGYDAVCAKLASGDYAGRKRSLAEEWVRRQNKALITDDAARTNLLAERSAVAAERQAVSAERANKTARIALVVAVVSMIFTALSHFKII